MSEVVVGGTTIGYHDTGVPTDVPGAQTVVFAHGLLFDSRMFEAQVEVLRGRYRCVAFDWRGQGTSPPTVDGYDIETLTSDALGVLRALDIGPVHWVGLSMGGLSVCASAPATASCFGPSLCWTPAPAPKRPALSGSTSGWRGRSN
jgi:3-oxoadipate enol-lactonase